MKNFLYKMCNKIFKKSLKICYQGSGEAVGIVSIDKKSITEIFIDTIDIIENGKPCFHSHIEISTTDGNIHKVNTKEIYVEYMPNVPHLLGVDKYNKYLKKFIKSSFYNYTLTDRPNTVFG